MVNFNWCRWLCDIRRISDRSILFVDSMSDSTLHPIIFCFHFSVDYSWWNIVMTKVRISRGSFMLDCTCYLCLSAIDVKDKLVIISLWKLIGIKWIWRTIDYSEIFSKFNYFVNSKYNAAIHLHKYDSNLAMITPKCTYFTFFSHVTNEIRKKCHSNSSVHWLFLFFIKIYWAYPCLQVYINWFYSLISDIQFIRTYILSTLIEYVYIIK